MRARGIAPRPAPRPRRDHGAAAARWVLTPRLPPPPSAATRPARSNGEPRPRIDSRCGPLRAARAAASWRRQLAAWTIRFAPRAPARPRAPAPPAPYPAAIPPPRRSPARPLLPPAAARAVVCAAQQQSVLAKAAAAGVSLPALLAAHPALALVDDRLAGEGTGKIFGMGESGTFWNVAIVFGLIWSLYYVAQRDVGGDEGDLTL